MTDRMYTSEWRGLRSMMRSIRNDVSAHRQDPELIVGALLAEARAMEDLLFKRRIEDADVLDIGSGHVPVQLIYFSLANRAVGIDINRLVPPWTLGPLLQQLRESGAVRAAKTLGRWALGSDARLLRAVAKSLEIGTVVPPRILQMSAQSLDFQDCSFDWYTRDLCFNTSKSQAARFEKLAGS